MGCVVSRVCGGLDRRTALGGGDKPRVEVWPSGLAGHDQSSRRPAWHCTVHGFAGQGCGTLAAKAAAFWVGMCKAPALVALPPLAPLTPCMPGPRCRSACLPAFSLSGGWMWRHLASFSSRTMVWRGGSRRWMGVLVGMSGRKRNRGMPTKPNHMVAAGHRRKPASKP